MSPTRRDVLIGATVAAVGSGAAIAIGTPVHPDNILKAAGIASTPIDLANPDGVALISAAHPAPIPTDLELKRWEAKYKMRYKALHQAQNAMLAGQTTVSREGDTVYPAAQRVDKVLETLELEEQTALSLVNDMDVHSVARYRGEGFEARRQGLPATANPARSETLMYYDHDEFMAWYAGWMQAAAGDELQRTADRPRGYIPPVPYVCQNCNRAEGQLHHEDCETNGFNFETQTRYTVRRPRPPGKTFG